MYIRIPLKKLFKEPLIQTCIDVIEKTYHVCAKYNVYKNVPGFLQCIYIFHISKKKKLYIHVQFYASS